MSWTIIGGWLVLSILIGIFIGKVIDLGDGNTHHHERLRGDEGCWLCFIGCPDDWTPETCTHSYSNHFENLLDSDGETLTYFAECDACGGRLSE